MTACAACGRPIPSKYLPGKLTASGPMHPGCWRKAHGIPALNVWEVQ